MFHSLDVIYHEIYIMYLNYDSINFDINGKY